MPELKTQCFQGWFPVDFSVLFHLYDGVRGSEKLVGKEGKKLGGFPLGVYTYLEISRKTILIFSDCFREFFWEKVKQISQDMWPTKSFTLIEGWMSYLHQALSLLQNIKLLVKIQQQRLEEAFPNYLRTQRRCLKKGIRGNYIALQEVVPWPGHCRVVSSPRSSSTYKLRFPQRRPVAQRKWSKWRNK